MNEPPQRRLLLSSPEDEACTLSARWIIPIDGPALPQGTITLQGARIIAVEPHGARSADRDLGNVAILPGLVNAHTHLDLSGLRGRCPPAARFTDWLRAVIAHRRQQTQEQILDDIRAGIAECVRFGTTLVGDISAGGLSWALLAEAPLRAVVFHELLGLSLARAEASWQATQSWLQAHWTTPSCRPGLSPHAPYSVRSWLFREAAERARNDDLPLAIHLAETQGERTLLESRAGEFVPFLEELGVWDADGLVRSPEDVLVLTRHVPHRLFVHGNYLHADHPDLSGSTVVYCPRTHAAFGHEPFPLEEYRERGIRIALGTDSLASNPDLDVLAEARLVHNRYPAVPAAHVLRMVTLSGAEALGWDHETGSLTPGKSADLTIVALPNDDNPDPHALVLASSSPIREVLLRGREMRMVRERVVWFS